MHYPSNTGQLAAAGFAVATAMFHAFCPCYCSCSSNSKPCCHSMCLHVSEALLGQHLYETFLIDQHKKVSVPNSVSHRQA